MDPQKRIPRILIVDDDPSIRDVMKDFCEVNGYNAAFAGNGFDAIALIREEGPFGLVIADFLMPGMHGVEFIREIRNHWRALPVIAMSAWSDVKPSLMEAGACRFFAKPFDTQELESAIEEILGDRPAADQD